jgi:hypothetical protein
LNTLIHSIHQAHVGYNSSELAFIGRFHPNHKPS